MTEWITIDNKKSINRQAPKPVSIYTVKRCLISVQYTAYGNMLKNIHDIKPVNIKNNIILEEIMKNINTTDPINIGRKFTIIPDNKYEIIIDSIIYKKDETHIIIQQTGLHFERNLKKNIPISTRKVVIVV